MSRAVTNPFLAAISEIQAEYHGKMSAASDYPRSLVGTLQRLDRFISGAGKFSDLPIAWDWLFEHGGDPIEQTVPYDLLQRLRRGTGTLRQHVLNQQGDRGVDAVRLGDDLVRWIAAVGCVAAETAGAQPAEIRAWCQLAAAPWAAAELTAKGPDHANAALAGTAGGEEAGRGLGALLRSVCEEAPPTGCVAGWAIGPALRLVQELGRVGPEGYSVLRRRRQTVASCGPSGGSCHTLTLELVSRGGGESYADPRRMGFQRMTAEFLDAVTAASEAAGRASGVDLRASGWDVRWSITNSSRRIDAPLGGPSLGMAFAVGLHQLLLSEPLDDVLISAAVDARGVVGPVTGIESKVKTAVESDPSLRLILVHRENLPGVQDGLARNDIEVRAVATLEEAVEAASGRARRLRSYLELLSAWPDRKDARLPYPGHHHDEHPSAFYVEPNVIQERIETRNPSNIRRGVQQAESPDRPESRAAKEKSIPWSQVWSSARSDGAWRGILMGAPGGGKTTLAEITMAREAQRALDQISSGTCPLAEVDVPVLIPVRLLKPRKAQRRRFETIEEKVEQRLRGDLTTPRRSQVLLEVLILECLQEMRPDLDLENEALAGELSQHLFRRSGTICLDGYDELSKDDRVVIDPVLSRPHRMSGVRMLVTGRPAAVEHNTRLVERLSAGSTPPRCYRIAPLEEPQILRLSRRLFGNTCQRRALLRRFTAMRRRRPEVQALATNPLLLGFLCLETEREDRLAPDELSRAKLFANLLEHVLGLAEGGAEHGRDASAGRAVLYQLSEVVWTAFREQGPEAPEVPLGRLFDVMPDKIEELSKKRILVPLDAEGSSYTMPHRSLMEFSAGLMLARAIEGRAYREDDWPKLFGLPPGSGRAEIRGWVAGFLSRKAWDPAWREVILFCGGCLEDPGLLLDLLNGEQDSVFGERHRLAAAVLVETPPAWRQENLPRIRELIRELERYEQEWGYSAGEARRMLAQAGRRRRRAAAPDSAPRHAPRPRAELLLRLCSAGRVFSRRRFLRVFEASLELGDGERRRVWAGLSGWVRARVDDGYRRILGSADLISPLLPDLLRRSAESQAPANRDDRYMQGLDLSDVEDDMFYPPRLGEKTRAELSFREIQALLNGDDEGLAMRALGEALERATSDEDANELFGTLQQFLFDRRRKVRRAASQEFERLFGRVNRLFGKHGEWFPKALPVSTILACLRSRDPVVRRLGWQSVKGALVQGGLPQDFVPYAAQATTDPSDAVRAAAARAIVLLIRAGADLGSTWHHLERYIKGEASDLDKLLEILGEPVASEFAAILGCLEEAPPASLLIYLGIVSGPPGAATTRVMAKLANYRGENLTGLARGLSESRLRPPPYSMSDEVCHIELVTSAQDQDFPDIRVQAIASLNRWADLGYGTASLEPLWERALADDDPRVRFTAIRQLRGAHPGLRDRRRWSERLLAVLPDPDPHVTLEGVRAVSELVTDGVLSARGLESPLARSLVQLRRHDTANPRQWGNAAYSAYRGPQVDAEEMFMKYSLVGSTGQTGDRFYHLEWRPNLIPSWFLLNAIDALLDSIRPWVETTPFLDIIDEALGGAGEEVREAAGLLIAEALHRRYSPALDRRYGARFVPPGDEGGRRRADAVRSAALRELEAARLPLYDDREGDFDDDSDQELEVIECEIKQHFEETRQLILRSGLMPKYITEYNSIYLDNKCDNLFINMFILISLNRMDHVEVLSLIKKSLNTFSRDTWPDHEHIIAPETAAAVVWNLCWAADACESRGLDTDPLRTTLRGMIEFIDECSPRLDFSLHIAGAISTAIIQGIDPNTVFPALVQLSDRNRFDTLGPIRKLADSGRVVFRDEAGVYTARPRSGLHAWPPASEASGCPSDHTSCFQARFP